MIIIIIIHRQDLEDSKGHKRISDFFFFFSVLPCLHSCYVAKNIFGTMLISFWINLFMNRSEKKNSSRNINRFCLKSHCCHSSLDLNTVYVSGALKYLSYCRGIEAELDFAVISSV